MRTIVAMIAVGACGAPLLAQDPSPAESRPAHLYRNPKTALALGMLVPGAGHVYAGEYSNGFAYAIGTAAAVSGGVLVHRMNRCTTRLFDAECDPGDPWAYKVVGASLVGLGVVCWVATAFRAPRAALRANERHRERGASATPSVEVSEDARTIRAGLRIEW